MGLLSVVEVHTVNNYKYCTLEDEKTKLWSLYPPRYSKYRRKCKNTFKILWLHVVPLTVLTMWRHVVALTLILPRFVALSICECMSQHIHHVVACRSDYIISRHFAALTSCGGMSLHLHHVKACRSTFILWQHVVALKCIMLRQVVYIYYHCGGILEQCGGVPKHLDHVPACRSMYFMWRHALALTFTDSMSQ